MPNEHKKATNRQSTFGEPKNFSSFAKQYVYNSNDDIKNNKNTP